LSIKVGGLPFADYVVNDPATNKTYLWPVYGPTGKSMTRSYPMKDVAGEKQDHYHHRGIWFGHQDLGGSNTWAEEKTYAKDGKPSEKQLAEVAKLGREVHRAFREMSTDDKQAKLVCELDYFGSDGKKLVSELRTYVFRVDGMTRVIDFNQDFKATEGDVTFGDMKDAGVCIRVPHSMAVDTQEGGRILNSEGVADKEAWSKRAKWCDYVGPVEDETLGVAILNHPSSFRHPTTWHVRTYGLFTANPFGTLDPKDPNGPYTLKKGEQLGLRHRFILHDGSFGVEEIEQAYQRYAASPQ
jgi:hypothetical protein